MREYYARLFREVRRGLFRFSKEQIGVSVVAGIAAAFVGEHLGTMNPLLVWRSALVSVVCYASIFCFRALWGIMVTPPKFDRQRVAEIQSKDREIEKKQARVVALEATLAAKHPRDEHREQAIARVLDDGNRKFLTWLLQAGRSDRQALSAAGFGGETAEDVRNQTASIHLVNREIIMSTNGVVEVNRFNQINPQFETALSNLLYPPGAIVG